MVGIIAGTVAVLAGGSVAEELGLIDVPWWEKGKGPDIPFVGDALEIGEAALAAVKALIPLVVPHKHTVTKDVEKVVWVPSEIEYEVQYFRKESTGEIVDEQKVPKRDALGNIVYKPGTNTYKTITTKETQRTISWLAGAVDAFQYMTQIPIIQLSLIGMGAFVATKVGPKVADFVMKEKEVLAVVNKRL